MGTVLVQFALVGARLLREKDHKALLQYLFAKDLCDLVQSCD